MTNKKYTDEEIRNLFPEQVKTEDDINCIKRAIYLCKMEITKQAAEFEKAKTGHDIWNIALAIYDYGIEITEQAAKDEKAKTREDIYWIAKAIYNLKNN